MPRVTEEERAERELAAYARGELDGDARDAVQGSLGVGWHELEALAGYAREGHFGAARFTDAAEALFAEFRRAGPAGGDRLAWHECYESGPDPMGAYLKHVVEHEPELWRTRILPEAKSRVADELRTYIARKARNAEWHAAEGDDAQTETLREHRALLGDFTRAEMLRLGGQDARWLERALRQELVVKLAHGRYAFSERAIRDLLHMDDDDEVAPAERLATALERLAPQNAEIDGAGK